MYIDGLPFVRAGGNGDPRFVWTAISVDAVDQFQLQTNGYSAIYEGQGIQNYTIKQGGPKYHGSVYEFFRNTALDTWGFFGAIPNPVNGAVKKPVEHYNEYGINLSGPLVPFGIWRDKLFFFGNYNGFRFKSETPTARRSQPLRSRRAISRDLPIRSMIPTLRRYAPPSVPTARAATAMVMALREPQDRLAIPVSLSRSPDNLSGYHQSCIAA